MVFVNFLNLCKTGHKKLPNKYKGLFIDSLRLSVKGGHGGNGIPKYGGQGGQGGCVYVTAKKGINLKYLMKKYPSQKIYAGDGENASKNRLMGRRGENIEINVPVGITVYHENGKKMGELDKEGASCIVAGGGSGGCPAGSFLGRSGHSHAITLDLKLIADIGMVGFPNAGKSTLLKAISKARPKIASYPFTTLRPQLGMIEYDDLRQISIADLPGLIEGAHANLGMGHKFLKHVERTRLLLLVVDLFGFKLSPIHPQRTCLENIFALNKELELYDPSLFNKPAVLILNKIDKPDSDKELENVMNALENIESYSQKCPENLLPNKFLQFDRILSISAKDSINIDEVKYLVREILDDCTERQQLVIDDKTFNTPFNNNSNKNNFIRSTRT